MGFGFLSRNVGEMVLPSPVDISDEQVTWGNNRHMFSSTISYPYINYFNKYFIIPSIECLSSFEYLIQSHQCCPTIVVSLHYPSLSFYWYIFFAVAAFNAEILDPWYFWFLVSASVTILLAEMCTPFS